MIKFGFIKVFTYGFEDASMTLFTMLQKICFLLPILIYFFTKKTWERYVALVPIILYSAQLVNIFNPNLSSLDEIEIYQTAKFMIPLLGILLLLAKANDHQEKIQTWINAHYVLLEHSIKQKFQHKESTIKNTREQLKKKDLGLKGLEVLKAKLESEIEQ